MKPIYRLIRLTLSPLLSFGVIRRFSFNVMKIDNLIEVKVDDIRFLVNTSDKVISKNIRIKYFVMDWFKILFLI